MARGSTRVLVVSGSDEVSEIAASALELWGYDAILAEDAQRATWVAAELRPAAVVLDLALPGVDVLDLATALRQHGPTRDVAIVALAEPREDAIEYARSRGCDSVVRAPLDDGDELAFEIERVLSRRVARRAA